MDSIILEGGLLALINAFGLFLIIVVLANSTELVSYRWFAVMTVCMIGWINSAYIGYSNANQLIAIIAYRLNLVFVSFFLFSGYMFFIVSFLKTRWRLMTIFLFIGATLLAIISLFSGFIIESTIRRDWGNEIVFGILDPVFNAFSVLVVIVFLGYFFSKYYKLPHSERRKLLYFILGTFILIVFNLVFNILSPLLLDTAEYQHLGDYSAVAFLGLSAYAILRRKFLGVRVALTALLITVIGMLLIVDILFLSRNIGEQAVKSVILAFFAVVSVFLVRSVLREIRQKEELQKVNKELDKSRKRYQDLATEQKDIIDVMGHEIRTPLTAIVQEIKLHKKYTLPLEKELLAEGKGENLKKLLPLIFDTFKTVDRASGHAVALVSDMLETARLDKKRFTLNYERFDLVALAGQSVELMTKTVESDTRTGAAKYDVQFHKPSFESLEIEADKTRIGQAMYALLNNAIKYRDPGKEVVKVRLSLSKKASDVVIEIVDNGIGIAEEDISKLGRKFLRLNPKTNGNLERPGGTGLGLFVVKGIMEYHHGKLEIESEGIAKGSTFRLRFPLEKPLERSLKAVK